MKVIVDTNVIISAAWRDRLPEKVILFIAQHPDIEWIASAEIIKEYDEVLSRPRFNMPSEILAEWAQMFESLITLVTIPNTLYQLEMRRVHKLNTLTVNLCTSIKSNW